jgi:hypothetical protein
MCEYFIILWENDLKSKKAIKHAFTDAELLIILKDAKKSDIKVSVYEGYKLIHKS